MRGLSHRELALMADCGPCDATCGPAQDFSYRDELMLEALVVRGLLVEAPCRTEPDECAHYVITPSGRDALMASVAATYRLVIA